VTHTYINLNQNTSIKTSTTIAICFQGYKVFYTTNPQLPIAIWQSQDVTGGNRRTFISGLKPNAVYTVSVLAYSSMGQGPMSNAKKVVLKPRGMFYFLLILTFVLEIIFCTTRGMKLNVVHTLGVSMV